MYILRYIDETVVSASALVHSKKRHVVENRLEQRFAAQIVHSCQQYWTILLHPIQAQQYCSILLTSLNNVGSKTLFKPVFNNIVTGWRFLPCTRGSLTAICSCLIIISSQSHVRRVLSVSNLDFNNSGHRVYTKLCRFFLGTPVSSCSKAVPIKECLCWIFMESSLEIRKLSSVNKVTLV